MTGAPVKYECFTSHDTFLKILQKYYQLPTLGTLVVSGHFHQKQQCQLVETFMFICMQKMNSIPNFVFETLQTCYFEYFESAWPCLYLLTVSPCARRWLWKCWNQFAGNFDVYLHAKNQLHISFLILHIVKTMIATLLFWELWECWRSSIKNHSINLKETFILICMQKINFITHFFPKIL